MSKDVEQFAIQTAIEALERYNTEKDAASHIKKEFDRKHGQTWHAFVGRNFGSQVTHEVCAASGPLHLPRTHLSSSPQVGHYIYFYLGQAAFLIFKSG